MSLKLLQSRMGIKDDNQFGEETIKAAMSFLNMSNVRAAHFFAQTAHETGGFRLFSENLNYSSQGLLNVFGKYFTVETSKVYARKPEKIANRVYANRMGNGNEASGDGYKYRGRGALQLTGKSNYEAFAQYIQKPEILGNPDLVATNYAFESALFFFERNGLWSICDRGINDAAITALTKRINGGTNGLSDRKQKTYSYFNLTQ